MVTYVYTLPGRYANIVGPLSSANSLYIVGSTTQTNTVTVTSNISGFNWLNRPFEGRGAYGEKLFNASHIGNGIFFYGSDQSDYFDASGYYGKSTFYSYGGMINYMYGGHGANVYNLTYGDGALNVIKGGTDGYVFTSTYQGVFLAENHINISGTWRDDVFTLSGNIANFTIRDNDGITVAGQTLVRGLISINGGSGSDIVDTSDYTGKVVFRGGFGDDTFVAQLGVTGVGSTFEGGAGNNTVIVYHDTALRIDFDGEWLTFSKEDGSAWFKAKDVETIDLRDAGDLDEASPARIIGVSDFAAGTVAEIA